MNDAEFQQQVPQVGTATPVAQFTEPPISPAPVKKKRKLLIVAAVIFVLGAVVVGAFFLSVALGADTTRIIPVTRGDYSKTRDEVRATAGEYSKLTLAATDYIEAVASDKETNSTIAAKKESVTKQYQTYIKAYNKLSALAALRDKDVKEAYDSIKIHNSRVIDVVTLVDKSLPTLIAIRQKCPSSKIDLIKADKSKVLQVYNDRMKDCEPLIKELAKAPEFFLSMQGTQMVQDMPKIRADLQSVQQLYSTDFEAYKVVRNSYNKLDTGFDVYTILRKPQAFMLGHVVDPTDPDYIRPGRYADDAGSKFELFLRVLAEKEYGEYEPMPKTEGARIREVLL